MNEKHVIDRNSPLSFSDQHWAIEPDIAGLRKARKLTGIATKAAIRKYEELARDGSLFALLHLGRIYSDGVGVKRDEKLAEMFYKEAHEKGSVYGTYYLALLYAQKERFREAKSLFEQCAEYDYAPAMQKLGVFYSRGLGVKPDMNRAIELWRKGVSLGNVTSNISLAIAYIKFKGGIANFPVGISLLKSSFLRFLEIWNSDRGSDLIK